MSQRTVERPLLQARAAVGRARRGGLDVGSDFRADGAAAVRARQLRKGRAARHR
jgi:hypothetical protein